jgi:DNA-binding XRE family transcriptional regulator
MPANDSTADRPDRVGAETVTQLRRALGRQLAVMRNRAGLSQWELAPLTGYSRSTLSDAELGRHRLRRDFWLRCDELLKADSCLVASYDRVESAAAGLRQRARGTAQLAREQHTLAGLQTVRPAPPENPHREPAAGDLADSRITMEACPHCRRPIAVLVVPAGPGRSS